MVSLVFSPPTILPIQAFWVYYPGSTRLRLYKYVHSTVHVCSFCSKICSSCFVLFDFSSPHHQNCFFFFFLLHSSLSNSSLQIRLQIQGELGRVGAAAAADGGSRKVGFVKMFSSIAKNEGISALQKGLVPSLLRETFYSSIRTEAEACCLYFIYSRFHFSCRIKMQMQLQ